MDSVGLRFINLKKGIPTITIYWIIIKLWSKDLMHLKYPKCKPTLLGFSGFVSIGVQGLYV